MRSRKPLEYTERVRNAEGKQGAVVDIEERGERPASIEVLWDDGTRSHIPETDLKRAA